MTTANRYSNTEEGYTHFLNTVKNHFAGRKYASLRQHIHAMAGNATSLMVLTQFFNLTDAETACLESCDKALADWDGRNTSTNAR